MQVQAEPTRSLYVRVRALPVAPGGPGPFSSRYRPGDNPQSLGPRPVRMSLSPPPTLLPARVAATAGITARKHLAPENGHSQEKLP